MATASGSKLQYLRVFFIASAVVLVFLSSLSFRELLADILHWEVHYMQKHWAQQEGYPPETEILHGLENYRKALVWMPDYPAYHESLAYLLRLRMHYLADPDEYVETGELSIQHSKSALENRPLWPYGYSQIAIVKGQLGQFDDEWLTYYREAMARGPWDLVNLMQIFEAAMMRWPILKPEDREIGLTALLRVLAFDWRHTPYMRSIMDNFARTNDVCGIIEAEELRVAETNRTVRRELCY